MTQENATQEDKAKIWAALDSEDAGVKAPVVDDESAPTEQSSAQVPDADAEGAAADKAATAPAEAPAVDPYAGLPESVRNELVGLKSMLGSVTDRLRNAEGHIGGLNSRLKQAAQAAKDQGGEAPTAADLRDAKANPQAMARLMDEYPEFGAAMKGALDGEIAKLREELKSSNAQPENAVTAADLQRLRTDFAIEVVHKDWQTTVQTPGFRGWLQGQPREVQMLAASDEPADAIRLLNLHSDAASKGSKQLNERLESAASIPNGRTAPARAKPVEQMTKPEYWAYLDAIDKQLRA